MMLHLRDREGGRYCFVIPYDAEMARVLPGRFQMSIFEGRNTVFTLLVVISQAHASLVEDAHPSFFK